MENLVTDQDLTAIEQANHAILSQQETINAVYTERNQCVALIARMAQFVGLRVGLRTSSDFEPGWQKCIMIDLPSGQVSWHLKDSELHLFDFPDYPDAWDNHSTEEKYRRVNAAFQIDQAEAGQPEHNDQAEASQPEQRGHAPAPTTWHIDLTNMDSQAPAPLVDVIFDHSIPQD